MLRFTSAWCCLFSPPLRRMSTRLPSTGQLVGPGRVDRECGHWGGVTGSPWVFRSQVVAPGMLWCRLMYLDLSIIHNFSALILAAMALTEAGVQQL